MTKKMLKPDILMADRFLTLLDEDSEQHTFQLYPDYNKKKGGIKLQGSLSGLGKILTQKNNDGYSICVTVNETDGKGRKKENIVGVRAIWRENDNLRLPELPVEPHIIIETSPGHFHEYILVADGILDEWESVQQRLVDDYGSDSGAKDLPRVLRVPGFYHQKNPDKPFMVKIVSATGELPTPWKEVKRTFPPVEKDAGNSPRSSSNTSDDWKGINPQEVISALSALDPDMIYPDWLSIGMALHDAFNGTIMGLKIWRTWSQKGQKYQDGDCDSRWEGFSSEGENRVKIETVFKMANDTGWRWDGEPGPDPDNEESDKKSDSETEGLSVAAQVIKTVATRSTFYHDSESTGYAEIKVDGRQELWPIESSYFKQWLGQLLYQTRGQVLNKNTWSDVQNVLLGKAIFEGDEITVNVRTAFIGNAYYLDLCRKDWSLVKVEPGRWTIVPSAKEIFFRRTSAMRPLPTPENYDYTHLPQLLGNHLNIDDADIRLIIAYLIESLMPDTEYPILELVGSPGSGKSTVQEMIREMLDPNKVNLRAAPKTVEDVFVSAANNHLVSYNNLSKIFPGMSDALCSLSTGGGHAGRKLYTNTDETAVDIQRPVCMNGIACLAKQPDLIDRLIRVTLQTIDGNMNRAKKQVMESFYEDLPRILGSLLSCFSRVLEILPDVELDRLPRMADFAKLCQALTVVYQWQPGLLETYYNNRSVSFEETLETSPAVMEVIKQVQRNGIFEGTIKTLFEEIKPFSTDNWVKTYRGLSEKLRMHTPALKAVGIKVWFDPVRKKDGYHVRIENVGERSSSSSPRSSNQAGTSVRNIWEGEHGEHGEHHSETVSCAANNEIHEVTI